MKDYNFTQPFAMRCDAEQFESVKNELEGMGYENYFENDQHYLELDKYFTNSFFMKNGKYGMCDAMLFTSKRMLIETFNRPLLLALAAMTDKPDGIIGEWFKGTNGVLVQKKDETDLSSIAVKATADELIKYFTYEKPFILPEKWYCPYENREQFEVMKKHFEKCGWSYYEPDGMRGCTNDDNDCWNNWTSQFNYEKYTKITFDQFMKYVVEQSKSNTYGTKTETEQLQNQIAELAERVSRLEKQPEPKQELRDKQEVWAWDDEMGNTMRIAAFYDSSRGTIFKADGTRGEYGFYGYYEPIPASQIPQWMKEAKLKLEN